MNKVVLKPLLILFFVLSPLKIIRANECLLYLDKSPVETHTRWYQVWKARITNFSSDLRKDARGESVYKIENLTLKASLLTRLRQNLHVADQKFFRLLNQNPIFKKSKKIKTQYTELARLELFKGLNGQERSALYHALFKSEIKREDLTTLKDTERRLNRPILSILSELKKLNPADKLFVYFSSALKTSTSPGLKTNLNPISLGFLSRMVRKTANSITWLLNPTPIDISPFSKYVDKIYAKLKKTPHKELSSLLTESDITFLIENDLLDDAFLYQQQFQNLTTAQAIGKTTKNATRWAFIKGPLIATSLILATLNAQNDFITADQYITTALDEQSVSVEIFLDTTPIPHTALRIGNKVYNPSQQTIQVLSVDQYLKLNGARIVQTVKLNLTSKELNQIESFFAERLLMVYDNNTGFYDCTTVVIDSLSQIGIYSPPVINASPSLTQAWIKSQLLIGNPQFSQGSLIYEGDGTSLGWKIPLTSLVQSVETKVFYMMSPIVASEQSKIREANQLFIENSEYQKLITERENIFYNKIKNDPDISDLIRFINVFGERSPDTAESYREEILTWLAQHQIEISELYEEKNNSAFLIEKSAHIKAIDRIIEEIKAIKFR